MLVPIFRKGCYIYIGMSVLKWHPTIQNDFCSLGYHYDKYTIIYRGNPSMYTGYAILNSGRAILNTGITDIKKH